MTQEVINVGANPNDGSGDPLRNAYIKINNNFSQLFSVNSTPDARFSANSVVTNNTNSNLNLVPNGGGTVIVGPFNHLLISNTDASSSSTTGALRVLGGIGATTAGFGVVYGGTVYASNVFIGNITGTAGSANTATIATYASTSGLSTNAINYAGSQLPNVSAVGANITLDNVGNVTIAATVSAYKYVHRLQVGNLTDLTTQTVNDITSIMILDSVAGATIGSATVTLPANANIAAGQRFTLSSNITVTALTVNAGSGTSIKGAPTTANTSSSFSWVFYRPISGTATWLRA
jgi:hypothetical protein